MLDVKWREVMYVIDLSKPNCHVCGCKLIRNMTKEQEWCVNIGCQVRKIKFNIPYKCRENRGN